MSWVLRRGWLPAICTLGVLAAPLAAEAQQPAKVPRIGLIRPGAPPDPLAEAFLQGLRDLGCVEGRTIAIEYRWAEGKPDRLPGLVAELVRLNVDVIVAGGNVATRLAKQATSTVPIVMSGTLDPVETGLISSLARPGGNITGSATLLPELGAKGMELLKEVLPKVSHVTVLYDPGPGPGQLRGAEVAARALGVQLQVLEVRGPNELESAFEAAKKARAGALSVLASAFTYSHRRRLVDLAAKHRLPAMYQQREFVEAGGPMAYGPNLRDGFRRAASFVDKILEGAKPADLPVEQPIRFELVINLRTAKALGLRIPRSLLSIADQVIQ